jgi:hypothetical protein
MMKLSSGRWRPGHLLLSWGAYWAGLIGVTMGPAIRATWRATRLPGGHGTVSAGFGDGLLNYSVVEDGVKTWAGTAPFSTVLLWLVGPPLVLWLVWLVVRSRGRSGQPPAAIGDAAGAGALSSGPPPADWRPPQEQRERVDRR